MQPAIRAEGLAKRYHLGTRQPGAYRTLRESISDAVTRPWGRLAAAVRSPLSGRFRAPAPPSPDILWALKDISFEVAPGEVIGIIGGNGAGKSTLLKILSRITEPSAGRVEIRGRVGSLLEVGTGFHPELTGSENIYLNASVLGMSHRETRRKFDEIVAFAGVERFLDTPVKRYSSGMYVRLAFAVAAHFEPEILIVDEVLAVGDAAFQKKCLGKMKDVRDSGRTVLFVSHNTPALEALCDRGVVLERGGVVEDADITTALARYQASLLRQRPDSGDLVAHPGRTPSSSPLLRRVELRGERHSQTELVRSGEAFTLAVEFDRERLRGEVHLGVVIRNAFGGSVLWLNSRMDAVRRAGLSSGGGCSAVLTCTLPYCPLAQGTYTCDLYLGDEHRDLDTVLEAVSFQVLPANLLGTGKLPPSSAGAVFSKATWAEAEKPSALASGPACDDVAAQLSLSRS